MSTQNGARRKGTTIGAYCIQNCPVMNYQSAAGGKTLWLKLAVDLSLMRKIFLGRYLQLHGQTPTQILEQVFCAIFYKPAKPEKETNELEALFFEYMQGMVDPHSSL